jgi:hypothetical protein
MVQPIYYTLTNLMLQLQTTSVQSNVAAIYYALQSKATASILRPYNITLQPLSHVLTI